MGGNIARQRDVMFPCDMQCLSLKRVRGNAGDAEPFDAEKSASVLFHDIAVNTGGDVEFIEAFTTEGASGCFHAGEVDPVELFAGAGLVADNTGAVAEGDP